MNPREFVKHFNRISEAPDAVPRLRRFILDLAVRGKLVDHVEREQVEKEYLSEPKLDALPGNWRALNFGKFCDIQGGNQPPKSQFVGEPRPGYVRLFQIRDLGESPVPTYIPIDSTNRFCREGDILIGRYGASVGKVFWAQEGAYNVALAKFLYPEDSFAPPFAFLVLKSKFFQEKLTGATRSAQAGFNKGDLAEIDMPLPPLAEQHRIVAKVDELMALCDRLEEVRKEREDRRQRLAASALHHLSSTAHNETFRKHARFYLHQFPRLTMRSEQIPALRQAIVNLALRGQLVAQDPRDEPASEILKQIDAERTRLMKAGEAKEQKQVRMTTPDAVPFDVPKAWCWASLGRIAYGFRYGTSMKCTYEHIGEPVLRIPNIKNGRVTTEDLKFGPLSKREAEDLRLELGDILMVRSNGSLDLVGRPALVEADTVGYCYAGYLVRVRTSLKYLDTRYVLLALSTTHTRNQIEVPIRTTVGLKNLNATELSRLAIPLAPLAEQRRIVAKVDELMTLCDRLQAHLESTQSESRRLLEAILSQALNDDQAQNAESYAKLG
jgi:type I restriction enzyme S subunit